LLLRAQSVAIVTINHSLKSLMHHVFITVLWMICGTPADCSHAVVWSSTLEAENMHECEIASAYLHDQKDFPRGNKVLHIYCTEYDGDISTGCVGDNEKSSGCIALNAYELFDNSQPRTLEGKVDIYGKH
jgi:hypothetical protein